MNEQLEVLVVSFGPVQGLFASSRKTKDLTLGSALLSDLTTAAARAAAHSASVGLVEMVVPSPAHLSPEGTSNKLVLLIKHGTAAAVGEQLRKAAAERLAEVASLVKKRCPADSLDEVTFDAQVRGFLECFWASAPLMPEGFGQARKRAERALDGRKSLRDFAAHQGIADRDKASVDGRLDGVVADSEKLRRKFPAAIRSGEQVDALGLIRRLWTTGEAKPVPSTTALAVGPWLRVLTMTDEGRLGLQEVTHTREALKGELRKSLSSVPDLDSLDEDSWVLDEAALRERSVAEDLAALFEGECPSEVQAAQAAYNNACTRVRDLKTDRSPTPYFAIVAADGDRIGKAFSELPTAAEHQVASNALGTFGTDVRALGAQAGIHVVYAGGDDVVALSSLDDALPFVSALTAAFSQVKAGFLGTPSISVGVAIVHRSERLSEAIRLARRAELVAKEHDNRSGGHVAVLLSKRSGGDLQVVLPRSSPSQASLADLVSSLSSGNIARGLAHEVRELGRRMQHVHLDAAKKEVTRVVTKKRSQSGEGMDEALVAHLLNLTGISSAIDGPGFVESCERLSALLRIALHLTGHTQATGGAA